MCVCVSVCVCVCVPSLIHVDEAVVVDKVTVPPNGQWGESTQPNRPVFVLFFFFYFVSLSISFCFFFWCRFLLFFFCIRRRRPPNFRDLFVVFFFEFVFGFTSVGPVLPIGLGFCLGCCCCCCCGCGCCCCCWWRSSLGSVAFRGPFVQKKPPKKQKKQTKIYSWNLALPGFN